jgi:GNAT superfamily N-acetyltransferase
MSLADKLALCRQVYAAAQLPLYVRITPFSHPPGLDLELERAGMRREDDTRVMVRTDLAGLDAAERRRTRIEPLGHHAFAELVGRFRQSPLAQRQAHAQRLQDSPVPFQGYALLDNEGTAVACGQVATEAELVGLYDVYTLEAHRGHGLATVLCAHLLALARQAGATRAYLQVEANNVAARQVYARLGFTDAYAYHYRTPA